MNILIVDDDSTYRRLLATILKAKHHEVAEAADGLAAWDLLQHDQYPFVISDWMMPGLNGLELVQHIRAANFSNYTYIILLTARNTRADIVGGLESGADDYLTKPFDLDELRARVAIGERILDLETRLRHTMEQLQILATYDSLTGLLNRRALYEAINNECSRARRGDTPISLIMLDIDHFKMINDQHGHLTGDQALCHVTHTILQYKRSYDLVGRWGGEEFLMALPGADLPEAGSVAERLRTELNANPLPIAEGKLLHIHASFGVATLNTAENSSLDHSIQQVDRALYRAKNNGRDQVCFYTEES